MLPVQLQVLEDELCLFPCNRHCFCQQAWIGKVAKQLVVMQIPPISVRYILSVQEFECIPLPAPQGDIFIPAVPFPSK